MTSLSIEIPSVFIPSNKTHLWLNLESEKSILSWYKNICDRRKKKNLVNMKKLKESLYKTSKKKRENLFNKLVSQENNYDSNESKGWKQTFLDFYEENVHPDDEIYTNTNNDIIFSLFKS